MGPGSLLLILSLENISYCFCQAVRRVGVFRYLVQLPMEEHMHKPREWTAALLGGKEQRLHFPAGWQECTALGTSLNFTTVGVFQADGRPGADVVG